jgi:hypothetical protein
LERVKTLYNDVPGLPVERIGPTVGQNSESRRARRGEGEEDGRRCLERSEHQSGATSERSEQQVSPERSETKVPLSERSEKKVSSPERSEKKVFRLPSAASIKSEQGEKKLSSPERSENQVSPERREESLLFPSEARRKSSASRAQRESNLLFPSGARIKSEQGEKKLSQAAREESSPE